MTAYAALVLAAGRSSRYRAAGGQESTKMVAPFRGEPLVRHVVRAASASQVESIIVVTGHAREAVEAALAGSPVAIVHNPNFADGLASSLKTGIAAIPAVFGGAVVLLGDMPLVTMATIDALIGAARDTPEADAVVPVWQGQWGNPVLLARSLFAATAWLEGDEGARRLLRSPTRHILEIAIAEAAVRLDVDEPASLVAVDGKREPPRAK